MTVRAARAKVIEAARFLRAVLETAAEPKVYRESVAIATEAVREAVAQLEWLEEREK